MDFNINVNVHFPPDPAFQAQLKRLESMVGQVLSAVVGIAKFELEESKKMDADIQAIIDQAQKNHDVEESAVTAINDLATKLAAAIAAAASLTPADRATLQAAVASISGSAADLGAAIATGDPATVNPPAPTA